MLKRPSARRKSHQESAELPLVPILDTMVTLIGFLLFTTSFIGIVSIESPLPQASPEEVQSQIENKEKPLQLTLSMREKDIEIWSPFQKIEPRVVVNTPTGDPDTQAIHAALLEIKKLFPKEVSVVLVPTQNTPYDRLVSLMDSVRVLEPTDPPLYLKNETTGLDETLKTLFPKVIFGNLLEEN